MARANMRLIECLLLKNQPYTSFKNSTPETDLENLPSQLENPQRLRVNMINGKFSSILNPNPKGRLRMAYKCNPVVFITEQ